MAAYWQVKSWNFSFSNYLAPTLSGGSASAQLNVDVDEMSDLVCYTDSNGSGSGSGNVLSLSANIRPGGLSMTVRCNLNNFFYDSAPQPPFDPTPVTIIIGDATIASAGFFSTIASATVTITATSFF